MVRAIPRNMGRIVWPAMVLALIGLAIYVSGGRVLLGALPKFQTDIEAAVAQRFDTDITIGAITGAMDGFSPRLNLVDLSLMDAVTGDRLVFPSASVRIDPWDTLLSRALRFNELILTAPRIRWSLDPDAGAPRLPDGLRDLFNSFERLHIRDAQILAQGGATGSADTLDSLRIDLDLVRDRSVRTVRLAVAAPAGVVLSAQGSGTGNPFEFSQFMGEAHGHLSGRGAALLARWFGFHAAAGGGANFWLSVAQGQPSGVIQIDLESLEVQGARDVTIDKLQLNASFAGMPKQAEIWIDQASVAIDSQLHAFPRVQVTRPEQGWRIRMGRWDVAPAVAALMQSGALPEKVGAVLAELNPRGVIESLLLDIASLENPLSDWAGQVEVTDASTAAFRNVPALEGIDASLSGDETGAAAWIVTRDFTLGLPKLYENPIKAPVVVGRLDGRWQRGALFLERGLLLAEATDHDALIQFEIDIPLSKPAAIPLEMRLAAAVQNAPASIRHAYVPYRMPPAAYDWLADAVPSGHLDEAIFLWHGGFRPYGHPSQTMQLAANLSNVSLRYQPDWPAASLVTSQLRISDTEIDVWSSRGMIADVAIEATRVGIRIASEAIPLAMQARATATPVKVLNTLRQLPALAAAAPVMDDLNVAGKADVVSDLNLVFDLRSIDQTVDVHVTSGLDNVRVASALLNLEAHGVTGAFSYGTETGFVSNELQGTVFDRPLRVEMGAHLTSAPDPLLAARVQTEVAVADLLSWQALTMPLPAEGTAPVEVEVTVADSVMVDIQSDLTGIAVDLPSPWGKAEAARAPLRVIWRDRDWAAWEIFWFGRLSAIGDFPAMGDLATAIDVTPRTRPPTWPARAPDPGLTLSGYIPSLDPAEWQSVEFGLPLSTNEASVPLQAQDLRVGRLLWRGEELGGLSLTLRAHRSDWSARFDLPWLSGEYTQIAGMPVSEADAGMEIKTQRALSLSSLDLQGLPTLSEELTDAAPPEPQGLVGGWMRQLPIYIEEVRRGDIDLGALRLVVDYRDGEGWQFRDIAGDFLGIKWLPSTHIDWRIEGEEATTLSLSAELNDIAQSLSLVGVTPIVATRSGSIDAEWQWLGRPNNFQLVEVKGHMDLEMRTGSFTSANAEASGALRLLSLMNLSGLFRRANVTQLFDAGVTFDRAEGRFDFNDGMLNIPGFSVEGSGGYFNFSSDIDLRDETVNGELVVTLPLVENIPWVAALAGGLPVAAGTYLVSKVFEDQVNQLSSGVYSVTGSLNEPEVVFERVFDAQSRAAQVENQNSSSAD